VLRLGPIDGSTVSQMGFDLGDVGLGDVILAHGEVIAGGLHHDASRRRCLGG
jgi:hypothetical protein